MSRQDHIITSLILTIRMIESLREKETENPNETQLVSGGCLLSLEPCIYQSSLSLQSVCLSAVPAAFTVALVCCLYLSKLWGTIYLSVHAGGMS